MSGRFFGHYVPRRSAAARMDVSAKSGNTEPEAMFKKSNKQSGKTAKKTPVKIY